MSFLKGFGTAVLSFLLFISLTVVSLGFLVNSTVLNPDFITRQVDKLDISSITRDIVEEQIAGQLSVEMEPLKDGLYNIIDEQEPWIKDQADIAIADSYDFFLGKTEKLDINISLASLKVDLKDSLWRELNNQLLENPDLILSELKPYLMDNTAEAARVIPELSSVPQNQLRQALDSYLDDIVNQIEQEGVSASLSAIVEELAKPYFDSAYDSFAAEIPDEFNAADEIPADVMEQLLMARKYIGYFRMSYYGLIAFMVILAAGIFLIHRNIQDPSRALGIDLLVFGAIDLIGNLLARSFDPASVINNIPAALGTWIKSVYSDILGVMLTFSIIILVIGVALIVISFIFKKKAVSD